MPTPRFQSLSPPSTRDHDNDPHFRVTPKVDPAAIPLPPQSPPVSTLSFSSQSSKNTQSSCASGSTAPTPNSHILIAALTAGGLGSPTLGSGSPPDASSDLRYPNSARSSLGSPTAYSDQPDDSDRKIKAEAKSNRKVLHSHHLNVRLSPIDDVPSFCKIEDLEITNRSLLAINATLEATKHRQANEIRDLRRKLRESRLVLPPREFRAIKSSLGPEDVADDEDTDEDEGDEGGDGSEHDATFTRVKGILEGLLESGRRALRAEPRDFERQGGGVKVLSAEEVRSWRGDVGDDVFIAHSAPADAESDEETSLRRRRVVGLEDSEAPPNDGDGGEAVTDGDEHNTTRILPPITVTFS